MSRKQLKRRAGDMAKLVIVGIFILSIACGVGFSAASAESVGKDLLTGAFGFDEPTRTATTVTGATDEASAEILEQSSLNSPASRDISAGLEMVDALEAQAAEARAQENAEAISRMESQKAMQGVSSATNADGAPISAAATEYSLPAVDWSVGRDRFIAEWAERIDAYLAGSNLAGYGNVFAEAAWDNGVDPRWSPAISNTESGKGSVCFLPCNAWGWGSSAWSDWPSAIRDHVKGLAKGYGYSLTQAAASTYCPPNAASWYQKTLAEMASI